MQLQFVVFSQHKKYNEILPELRTNDNQFDLILDDVILCLHKCDLWSKDMVLVIRIIEKDSISYIEIQKARGVYSVFSIIHSKPAGYFYFNSVKVFIYCDTIPPYLIKTDRSKRFKAKFDFRNLYIEDPPAWLYSFVDGKFNLIKIVNKCPDC